MQIHSAKLTAAMVGAGLLFSFGMNSNAIAQQGIQQSGFIKTHHRLGSSGCQTCGSDTCGKRGFLSRIFRRGGGSGDGRNHCQNCGWGVVKHPVHRHPVVYRQYWPNKFYGQPGAFAGGHRYPMVYQPTDTTQLGFYYQQVPQWRPNHSMIPPAPCPPNWHNTCGSCNQGYGYRQGGVNYSQPANPNAKPTQPTPINPPKPVKLDRSAQEMPIYPRK